MKLKDRLSSDISSCDLSWNQEKMILADFEDASRADYSRTDKHFSGLRLSKEQLERGTLLVSEEAIDVWTSISHGEPDDMRDGINPRLHLNDHIFVLEGGIFQQGENFTTFTYDWRENTAVKLESDRREPVRFRINTTNNGRTPYGRGLSYIQDHLVGLEEQELKEKDLQELQQYQVQRQQLLEWDYYLMQQFNILSQSEQGDGVPEAKLSNQTRKQQIQNVETTLENIRARLERMRKRLFSFKVLVYRNIRPVVRVTDFDIISLHEERFPLDRIFPDHIIDILEFLRKTLLRNQGIALIRLIQLVRHLVGDITFDSPEIRDISNSIDNIKILMEAKREETRAIAEGKLNANRMKLERDQEGALSLNILLEAIDLIKQPPTSVSFFEALLSRESQIKNLFLNPDPEQQLFYLFNAEDSIDVRKHRFDNELVLDQILAYEVNDEEVPLNLKLCVRDDQDANYALFAFVAEDANTLYLFETSVDNLVITAYSSIKEDKTVNLDLKRDKDGQPTLKLFGTGIVLYRYRPLQFKRVKGIMIPWLSSPGAIL